MTEARGPGRPKSGEGGDVRDALLAAAAKLFAEQGFSATSLRELGTTAGVTPAMVSYYFGSKEGLYQALLEQTFEEVLPNLEDGATGNGGEPMSTEAFVTKLFKLVSERMTAQPWLPSLIVREVLSEEGAFRDEFVERFAKRLAGLIITAFERAKAAGQLRADADPKLAYVNLLSLVVFPLLARPVFERVLEQSYDDAGFLEGLQAHGCGLFLNGLRAEPS